MPEEPVTRLSPLNSMPEELVVRFSGDALKAIDELRGATGLGSREEVVVRAVELLLSAVNKEVLLRDSAGRVEVLRGLWQA